VTEWSEGGLRFAAVSAIPREELQLFQRLFREAAAAGGTKG
jgi:hypothetical protein